MKKVILVLLFAYILKCEVGVDAAQIFNIPHLTLTWKYPFVLWHSADSHDHNQERPHSEHHNHHSKSTTEKNVIYLHGRHPDTHSRYLRLDEEKSHSGGPQEILNKANNTNSTESSGDDDEPIRDLPDITLEEPLT